jgi:hypothetical protein
MSSIEEEGLTPDGSSSIAPREDFCDRCGDGQTAGVNGISVTIDTGIGIGVDIGAVTGADKGRLI